MPNKMPIVRRVNTDLRSSLEAFAPGKVAAAAVIGGYMAMNIDANDVASNVAGALGGTPKGIC